MKMTVAVPVWNQLNDSKGIIALLYHNTSRDSELLVIDNGSTDPYKEFFDKYLKPQNFRYIRNETNIGLVKTYQQIFESCESDVLAILHNDTFVYEKDWDKRILSYFEEWPDLGAVGFFGTQGCGPNGERIQDVPGYNIAAGVSNMLEAEIHGFRMNVPWKSAAIFDGLGMVFRMDMLRKAGGFDQRYNYHHIYDRDIALESLRHGYRNIVMDVPCHHMSGLTANRADYQEWVSKQTEGMRPNEIPGDLFVHNDNTRIFNEKWGSVLPLYVQDDFTFRTGSQNNWIYKNDAILSL